MLPLLLLLVLFTVLTLQHFQPREKTGSARRLPETATVSDSTVKLRLEYGDGVEKSFTALPWKEGMTVQTALELATSHPRGIVFVQQGSGEMTLLTAIDGLQNQGGGDQAKNWIYWVNGKKAEKSFAIHQLNPGDAVLWTFSLYE